MGLGELLSAVFLGDRRVGKITENVCLIHFCLSGALLGT